MAQVVGSVREWLATARWWTGELFGSSAYQKYLARHRHEHPDHEPMSEREFWRMRDADAERNVQTGCC
nr:YbdD/YjiX family protein [Actinomycetales bacterium]